jgi:transporter family-2 protein
MLLSILGGASVVLGRMINAKLSAKIGTLQSTLINYIVGLSFTVVIFFVTQDKFKMGLNAFTTIPLWAYLGGLMGVIIIMTSNYVTPRVSAFYITLLVFIGQLFLGTLIDFFIFKELSLTKAIGGILVLAGLSYNLWIDQNKVKKKQ